MPALSRLRVALSDCHQSDDHVRQHSRWSWKFELEFWSERYRPELQCRGNCPSRCIHDLLMRAMYLLGSDRQARFVQSACAGRHDDFNGDLNTSGSAGINLTGAAFTFRGNATTALSSGGPIQIANSGILTTTFEKTLSADGLFAQTNTGAAHLAGNILTNNATLSFLPARLPFWMIYSSILAAQGRAEPISQ